MIHTHTDTHTHIYIYNVFKMYIVHLLSICLYSALILTSYYLIHLFCRPLLILFTYLPNQAFLPSVTRVVTHRGGVTASRRHLVKVSESQIEPKMRQYSSKVRQASPVTVPHDSFRTNLN